MTVTLEKAKKLQELNIPIKTDINQRIEMVIQEIQQQLKQYEEEAIALYWPEKRTGNA